MGAADEEVRHCGRFAIAIVPVDLGRVRVQHTRIGIARGEADFGADGDGEVAHWF